MNEALTPMTMEIVGGRWDGLLVAVQGAPRPRYFFDAATLDRAAGFGAVLLARARPEVQEPDVVGEVVFSPLARDWNKIMEVNHE